MFLLPRRFLFAAAAVVSLTLSPVAAATVTAPSSGFGFGFSFGLGSKSARPSGPAGVLAAGRPGAGSSVALVFGAPGLDMTGGLRVPAPPALAGGLRAALGGGAGVDPRLVLPPPLPVPVTVPITLPVPMPAFVPVPVPATVPMTVPMPVPVPLPASLPLLLLAMTVLALAACRAQPARAGAARRRRPD